MVSQQYHRGFSMLILLALLVVFVSALAPTFPHLSSQKPLITKDLSTLSQVSLVFNNLPGFTGEKPIQSLSTSNFSTLSSVAPTEQNIDEFYPFGKTMSFSFQTNSVITQHSTPLATTSATASILYEFQLSIDDLLSPVSTTAKLASTVNINSQSEDGAQSMYAKHNIFSGKRTDPKTLLVDTMILSVLPNSGDFTTEAVSRASPDLDTQSTSNNIDALVFNPLSTDAYTVEAFVFKASGDIIHIQSFSTLIYQQQRTKLSLETELTKEKGSDFAAQAQVIDSLSVQLDLLQELQSQTEYDLAVYTFDLKNQNMGSCATQGADAPHGHPSIALETNNDEHSTFSPQWARHEWPLDAVQKDTVTQFTMSAYSSLSYSLYASDTTRSSSINTEKVTARLNLLMAFVNQPYFQQLRLIWRFSSFEIRTSESSELWNVTDDSNDERCTVPFAETLLDDFGRHRASDEKYQKSTTNHLFVHCTPKAGAYVAGIHFMAGACLRYTGVGWSMIMNPTNYITTAHENGHALGVPHPFQNNPAAVGTYGGIMDYNFQRLRDSSYFEGDARRLAFDYTTSAIYFRNWIGQLRVYQGMSMFIDPEDCFSTIQLKQLPDDATSYESPTCTNGIIEPWEECDDSSSCCVNCKLVDGATCSGPDSQCCTNCHAALANETPCTLDGIGPGYCNRDGTCLPFMPLTGGLSLEEAKLCPDSAFFGYAATKNCGYTWPSQGGCLPLDFLSPDQIFQSGTLCIDKISNNPGVCIPDLVFNSDQVVSKSCVANSYTWQFVRQRDCDCAAGETSLRGMNLCQDLAGTVVSSSFCSSQSVPSPPTCDCSALTKKWSYTEFTDTGCENSMCGTGVLLRQATCEVNGVPTDRSSCDLSLGPPLLVQEVTDCNFSPCDEKNDYFCAWNLGSLPWNACTKYVKRIDPDMPSSSTVLYIIVLVAVLLIILIVLYLWWKKLLCFGRTNNAVAPTDSSANSSYVDMDTQGQQQTEYNNYY